MIFELFNNILYNIQMILWFILPLILCRLADILFGSITAYKSIDLEFNLKKMINSIICSIVMIVGIILLISGIVALPEIMEYYNIKLIDTEILKDLVNILMVITLLVGTTITYGKDALNKLSALLNIKK